MYIYVKTQSDDDMVNIQEYFFYITLRDNYQLLCYTANTAFLPLTVGAIRVNFIPSGNTHLYNNVFTRIAAVHNTQNKFILIEIY